MIGPGVIKKLAALCRGRRAIVVSEPNAWKLFGKKLGLEEHALYLLPQGEKAKDWAEAGRLLEGMAEAGLGRDGVLVAFGGGAVTDCAGFAAASYLRGIDWISVPSTLLGQLDSGIGGKTGVNLGAGKNLAGAFHMPEATVCESGFLDSLPERERVSGLAEALKIGLVFDRRFWRELVREWDVLIEGKGLESIVRRTAACKQRVVDADPFETRGRRILLNFGHTLGHALETAGGHGTLRHGEAVIWGMRAAARLSRELAGLPESDYREIEIFLKRIAVPKPRVGIGALLDATRKDKKNKGGTLRFVLLNRIGRPAVVAVSPAQAAGAARALLS